MPILFHVQESGIASKRKSFPDAKRLRLHFIDATPSAMPGLVIVKHKD